MIARSKKCAWEGFGACALVSGINLVGPCFWTLPKTSWEISEKLGCLNFFRGVRRGPHALKNRECFNEQPS